MAGPCVGAVCPIAPTMVTGIAVRQPVPPASTTPRHPIANTLVGPMPVAIAIDSINGLLLIADQALPLIHRVRISDGTLDTPIATGVPVRDVVVTPRVPDSYDIVPDTRPGAIAGTLAPRPTSEITFSRYLYAIDDTDGSVLAIEYSTPGAPGFGGVIAVDVEGSLRADRIPMPIVARTLEIVTPQFDTCAADPRFAPTAPDACTPVPFDPTRNQYGFGLCTPTQTAPVGVPPSPTLLRGVFLVVAGADGGMRIVDVYDLDAPCRGRAFGVTDPSMLTPDCTSPTVTGDNVLSIRRHRPRSQQLLTNFVTLINGPSVLFPGGGTQVLGNDGRAPTSGSGMAADNVPTLGSITCPAPLAQVWPDPTMDATDHVVCSLTDPFAAIQETWSATYQGPIPGTYTTSGNPGPMPVRMPDGNSYWVINTRTDYCLRGVIGSNDAQTGAIGDEALYHGDLLAITGAMNDAQLNHVECRNAVGIAQIGEPQQPILFPIHSAYTMPPGQTTPYTGQIWIPTNTLAVGRRTTIDDVIRICFQDMLLTMDVRSQNAYTVTGSRTAFLSRVARDTALPSSGRCTYGSSTDTLLNGHAFHGHVFHNARIAFEPRIGVGQVPQDLTEIRMVLTGGPTQLGLDLSLSLGGTRAMALPGQLHYVPSMWGLYAIETERRGLVEMTLRPLSVTNTVYQ